MFVLRQQANRDRRAELRLRGWLRRDRADLQMTRYRISERPRHRPAETVRFCILPAERANKLACGWREVPVDHSTASSAKLVASTKSENQRRKLQAAG
jgi:hypothetical protein